MHLNIYRCQRASQLSWEKVEIDNMMSWLSTLGGGFSSLGDEFTNCVSSRPQPHEARKWWFLTKNRSFSYRYRLIWPVAYQNISWNWRYAAATHRLWCGVNCTTAYHWYKSGNSMRPVKSFSNNTNMPKKSVWAATSACTECAMAFGWNYSRRSSRSAANDSRVTNDCRPIKTNILWYMLNNAYPNMTSEFSMESNFTQTSTIKRTDEESKQSTVHSFHQFSSIFILHVGVWVCRWVCHPSSIYFVIAHEMGGRKGEGLHSQFLNYLTIRQ